jgi:uncharacterized protein (TIGR02569 family)
MPAQPPPAVLAAFGVAGEPLIALPGGQGTSWRAGDMVLKPADGSPAELRWQAYVYSRISGDGFRIARTLTTADSAACVAGWRATQWVAGQHEPRRWADIIAVGERYHAALGRLPRPAFLAARDSPWATGDLVAWGERPAAEFDQVPHIRRLVAALRPVTEPSQLIHGDLGGNVLFHPSLPPAIIDFSPYWRPAAFASAIVVADALAWEGADAGILAAVSHLSNFGQYLIRALIYRMVTERVVGISHPAGGADPWAPAAALALLLAR